MKRTSWVAVVFVVGLVAAAIIMSGVCRKKTPAGTGSETSRVAAGSTAESSGGEKARGWIEVKGADFIGHEVRDAATGAAVARIDSIQSTLSLPAGIYDVEFGSSSWKGVIVREGETTVLEPGGLTLNHASLQGHDVVAVETGTVQGKIGATNSHIVLIPGTYAVMFGPLTWTADIVAGKTTTLDPGTITVKGADIRGHRILDAAGTFIGEVSATGSTLPLPPGSYAIELDGSSIPFTIEAGQAFTLERK